MRKYGEILFLGPCNLSCYYCLSKEMSKLKQDKENNMNTHFSNWKDFDKYLNKCKKEGVDTIYLSSVTTEPLMYKYVYEIIQYLKDNNFKVGIRTNGTLAINKLDSLMSCDEEISLSLNSFDKLTNMQICGCDVNINWDIVLSEFRERHKKCRISIVVNRYNYREIPYIIKYLSKYSDVINYIQLRKVYKYNEVDIDNVEQCSFESVLLWVKENCKYKDTYFESKVYKYKDKIDISIWEDVFKKDSIQSINYFTNGIISTNNLLIPAYEKGETE